MELAQPSGNSQPAVRTMSVSADDEESSILPRWNAIFHNHHHPLWPGHAGIGLKWNTLLDGKWHERYVLHKGIELALSAEEIDSIMDEAASMQTSLPDECLGMDDVYTYGGYSPTKCRDRDSICWNVMIVDSGDISTNYYIRKDSRVWKDTKWGRLLINFVTPHLQPLPAPEKKERKLP